MASTNASEQSASSSGAAVQDQLAVVTADGPVRQYELSPDLGINVGAAVKDLVNHFEDTEGEGYGGRDMVIWHGGRLAAVVRKGIDGRPQYTIFEDPTWL